MAGITLTQAQDNLDLWITASQKVAVGQSYSIGSRSLTRADAADIKAMIEFWNGKVNELTNGAAGIRVRGLTLG